MTGPGTAAAEVRFVASQAAFDELLAELGGTDLLAVDTEAASFHRYFDRIYLIQLSTRTVTAVVDPLAVEDLAGLGRLLADRDVEILFHDADYDLRLFDQQYRFHATRLFDTRIAAQLLHEPGVGLAALLEKYVGVTLDKRFQRADWSARPLTPPMLAYAAADTHHLPGLRDLMEELLRDAGRLAWAQEEFALLEETRHVPHTEDDEPAWLRMKGAKALKGRQLAVLRELHAWREKVAQKSDKAAFRVLNNEPIFAMAKAPPSTPQELRQIPGISSDFAERRGKEVLAAVARALALPDDKLPRVERPPRRTPDPDYEARLDKLKAARNALAEALPLAPGVLCPNGTLEAIARAHPDSLDALRATPQLRRWQADVAGEALWKALVA